MNDDRLQTAEAELRGVLAAIFELEHTDLDFGIHRVLAEPRAELWRWIDDELSSAIADAVAKAEGDAGGATELACAVCLDLAAFFGRHRDGELRSPRSDGPRPGQVSLGWEHEDRGYLGTIESPSEYRVVLRDVPGVERPRLVLRLAAAVDEPEQSKPGSRHRYVLRSTEAIEPVGDELVVWLEHRVPDPGRGEPTSQAALCQQASERILAASPEAWRPALRREAPHVRPVASVLEHHLRRATRKDAVDHFVHHDLRGHLQGALDAFLQQQMLALGVLERRPASELDGVLARVRAVRSIGGALIERLAGIESLRLRVHRKPKLVLRTGWLVPLSRVPDALLPAVADNVAQHGAWSAQLGLEGPFSPERLRAHPSALLDTIHFSRAFTHALLASIPDLEAATVGRLVRGDNWSALRLLEPSFAARVTTVFIDPPYNTGLGRFPYKDDYRPSSWLTMMRDRLQAGRRLMSPMALFFATIDSAEVARLRLLCDDVFGPECFVADVAWEKRYTRSNNAKLFYSLKDTVLVYRASTAVTSLREPRSDKSRRNYSNPDGDPRGDWIGSSYVNPATKAQRPNLVYPLENPFTAQAVEHPTHAWKYDRRTHRAHVEDDRLYWGPDGGYQYPRLKTFLRDARDGMVPVDVWGYRETGTTDDGGHVLKAKFGSAVFENPKPPRLVRRAMALDPSEGGRRWVLDFFGGSGTTAEAVIDRMREEGTDAGFIVIEQGRHFETVVMPRVIKAAFAPEWKDGRAVTVGPALGGVIKWQELESYDDAIENVALGSDAVEPSGPRLRYELDLGRAEAARLHPRRLVDPWGGTIRTRRDGALGCESVDLVETFNELLGLRVSRYDPLGEEGLLLVAGIDARARRVIVLWRDCERWPEDRFGRRCREVLAAWAGEIDVVYVNGEPDPQGLGAPGAAWRLEPIEAALGARMFERADDR